jgi:hypothetical protein
MTEKPDLLWFDSKPPINFSCARTGGTAFAPREFWLAGGPASMARTARVPLDKSEGVVKGAVLDLVLLVLTLYFSLSSSPLERFGSALPPLQLGCRRRGGRTDVAIASEAENQVADAAQEKEEDDSEHGALTE